MDYYKTLDALKIPYEDQGTGPALLFIPGWTMSRLSFRKQYTKLSNSYGVIAPDLRGQGDSEKNDVESIDFSVWSRDLHDLLVQLNIKKVILIGWSLGALTMWHFCQQYAFDRVVGLVHIDMAAKLEANWVKQKNVLIDRNYSHYLSAFIDEMFMSNVNQRDRQLFFQEALKTPASFAKSLNQLMTELDLRGVIQLNNLPLLFIFGKHTRFFSKAEQNETISLAPQAEVSIFDKSSHCPFWEEADRFNTLIGDFAKDVYRLTPAA